MRASALFGAKNIGFFILYRVSARTKEGVNFSWLCADIFYGRLLTKIISKFIFLNTLYALFKYSTSGAAENISFVLPQNVQSFASTS